MKRQEKIMKIKKMTQLVVALAFPNEKEKSQRKVAADFKEKSESGGAGSREIFLYFCVRFVFE
jgi:hypothetical protein